MKNNGIVEIPVKQDPPSGCCWIPQLHQRRWETAEEEAARRAPEREEAMERITVDLERWNDPVRHAMLVAMAEGDSGTED